MIFTRFNELDMGINNLHDKFDAYYSVLIDHKSYGDRIVAF